MEMLRTLDSRASTVRSIKIPPAERLAFVRRFDDAGTKASRGEIISSSIGDFLTENAVGLEGKLYPLPLRTGSLTMPLAATSLGIAFRNVAHPPETELDQALPKTAA
jgi:hypothetical protein